jgi:hypothetical protein
MTFMSNTGMSTASRAPVPAGGVGQLRMTPGRWVALAVGVPVALALIGWTGFSLITTVARGSYPFSYALPVDRGQVTLSMNTGNITLRSGSAGDTARLTGIVQYGLVRPGISENTTPSGADIGINCDGIDTDCGMNSTLAVPAGTGVTLWSNGGDIAASGFASDMTLAAQGGNVTATNLSGNLNLDSGGGDLAGTGLSGTIQVNTEGGNVNADSWTSSGSMGVNTGGGDLNASGLSGNLDVSAQGGNVDASGVASSVLSINSGGGDVTLTLSQVPKNLQIVAQGGNVDVILPAGTATYNLSLPDTSGGNVNYPTSLVNSKSTDKISIDSGGGDISISQGSSPA